MMMSNRLKKHSLKFISFFLSFLIWIYVLNTEKIKFEKIVEVDYILASDMAFAVRPPHEVTFTIDGPKAFMHLVTQKNDRLVIDLKRVNEKDMLHFSVNIDSGQLNLPFGMQVERTNPRKLNLSVEKKIRKRVPLRVQYAGEIPHEVSILNPLLEPSEIDIEGPKSVISKIKELYTRPVEIENLVGFNQVPVDIQLPDERLMIEPHIEVKLHYKLKTIRSHLTLHDVPIQFISDKIKSRSNLTVARMKLFVSDDILKNKLSLSSKIHIWADVPKDAHGRILVPLKVKLPANIQLLELSPKTIIVNMQ
jgi:YbbR domain-containing protein